jgi:pyridoxal phosphate enzyme (YggS family)
MTKQDIINNLDDVNNRIKSAAQKSGRDSKDVTLIAVTKTIDTERIGYVFDYGIRNMGENRVQELLQKYEVLDKECSWHLIGHLQTNKVKYIIDKVKMIHSVDSYELVNEIDSRAAKAGRKMDILLQVNVSGEETKFGIDPSEVTDYVKYISQLKNTVLRGLMTIAPYTQNPEETRPIFKKLYKIYIDIKREKIDNVYMDYLSMGMSNDFDIAIEEGANMVRIGTAIFGKRIYL